MAQQRSTLTPSAWVGWIYFAGTMMMVVGGLQVIAGLTGILRHSYYAVAESGLVAFNYLSWGWIDLILGIVTILAGIGLWSGAAWARIFAIVLVVLNMLDNLAFMSAYPLWSIIALVIDGFILYALTMHGTETKLT